MAIPDYQSLMLPLLKLAADGQEHTLDRARESLADSFQLSENDRRELLPSGRQQKFDNRVGWARTYLQKAGLLESTGRSKFRITRRGLDVLETSPPRIDVKYLERYPEFNEFRKRSLTSRKPDLPESVQLETPSEAKTPEENLELSYMSLRERLAQELLEQMKKAEAKFFERLTVDLLVAMGYGGSRLDAAQVVGQSGDGGIDGIIKEDKLGLDVVYIQAKRWDSAVGRPIVQAFVGSLEGQRARKGVIITTSSFSTEAKDYVNRTEKKIVLIDGKQLAQLMIDHDVGVTEVARYVVKKVDLDYFDEEF